MNSPTLYPFPFDRYDGSASNTTPPTSDPILQVEYPVAGFQPKPGQECWCQQRRASAGGAIDLDEIPGLRSSILAAYSGTICALMFSFRSLTPSRLGPHRQSNRPNKQRVR